MGFPDFFFSQEEYKSSNLFDAGGNMQYPALYLNGTWTDSWPTENPGVLQADPGLLPLANNGLARFQPGDK